MNRALTIAGSDPSGGAGIQADLRVFQSLGVYGLSAVTSLTSQNTKGVTGIMTVPPGFLQRQLHSVLSDIIPEATKIGMIHSCRNVRVIAKAIRKYSLENVVLDPVLVSTSGKSLSEKGIIPLIRDYLLPLCTLITPNIIEASILSGINITSEENMRKAAVLLRESGPQYVLITGGHLEGTSTDVLFDGKFHYFRKPRHPGEYHGTGCVFSAAIAAYLSGGHGVLSSVQKAEHFMKRIFRQSFNAGGFMKLFHISNT